MTTRERFKRTMSYGHADRVPYFEEGIRPDVLKEWYKQGLQPGKSLSDIFRIDHFEEIAPEMDPLPQFWPESLTDLEKYRKRLDPDDRRRLPHDWRNFVQGQTSSDNVNFLRVHRGFFLTMGVDRWQRFEKVISFFYEQPDFIRRYMAVQNEFACSISEKIIDQVSIDAAIISEPIGGNEGPLISPEFYESFVLKSYIPLLDLLRAHGVEIIILRTYANARIYIPSILKYGINCLWACETNVAEMDYRELRREFGRDLRLIGGLDLDVLRSDEDAIRREIMEKVPPLIADGGYIPMADGRVRKDISYENYKFYRHLLEKVTTLS